MQSITTLMTDFSWSAYTELLEYSDDRPQLRGTASQQGSSRVAAGSILLLNHMTLWQGIEKINRHDSLGRWKNEAHQRGLMRRTMLMTVQALASPKTVEALRRFPKSGELPPRSFILPAVL